MDVGGVVAERERVVVAVVGHEADDLVWLGRALLAAGRRGLCLRRGAGVVGVSCVAGTGVPPAGGAGLGVGGVGAAVGCAGASLPGATWVGAAATGSPGTGCS